MELERAGVPTVVITSTGFTVLARAGAKAGGVAQMRFAEYPGTLGNSTPAQIEQRIRTVLVDQVVDALTRAEVAPTSPAAGGRGDPRRTVFAGTLEEIHRFFTDREWTEGLPIVPPTRERIEAFLAHTDYPADRVIATLPSANLTATPWTIAANAVMAGCQPEHMPIVVAAVEALADEKASLSNVGSSSGLIPFIVVNGPIVQELGLAAAEQLMGRAPNTAIGRAVGLIVRNIAGFRPGRSYMATFGYPLSFALAEDDALNPWEPLHVTQGFDRGASTVTVGVTTNWGSQPEASSGPDNRSGAEIALELLAREVCKKARVFNFATIGPEAEHVMVTVLMSPSIARALADAGHTKRSICQYVYENACMPLGEFSWLTAYTYPAALTVPQKVQKGLLPIEFEGPPEKMVRVLCGPEIVHIVVCGDPNRNRLMVLEGGHTEPTTRAIRRVAR